MNIMEQGTGDTPLIVACRFGWVGIVELCLDYGAKNDPHPHFGKTALQVRGLVRFHVHKTVDVFAFVVKLNLLQQQTAVEAGQVGCLKALLHAAKCADMDVTIANHMDDTKSTPLNIAARHGDMRCLTLLLEVSA